MQINLTESHRRLYEKLYRDLGNDIATYLADPDVNEVMLNPDGKVWVDRSSTGQSCTGSMTRAQAFSILNSVAGIHNFVVSQHSPRLEAELPYYQVMQGERFTGQIPPIVSAPCFTIRKKSGTVFKLDDYVKSQRMTDEQAVMLCSLVKERKNILISGGPGSGKTTVTNALIVEAVEGDQSQQDEKNQQDQQKKQNEQREQSQQNQKNQRFLILEDLPELQCAAVNRVAMLTSDDVDMTGLLRAAMRMRPDRILIGEVRGKEALDMLKAWNTGCPGGICTVHANGAEEAVQRILDLSMEAGLTVPPIGLVLHTVDAVVSVVRKGNQKGFINEIVKIEDYKNGKFIFKKLA